MKVALEQAMKRRKKLAIIHKANVLPLTSGLFLETARELAKEYPEVDAYDVIVDAAALKLVREPGSFDVLVSTNLFGDNGIIQLGTVGQYAQARDDGSSSAFSGAVSAAPGLIGVGSVIAMVHLGQSAS